MLKFKKAIGFALVITFGDSETYCRYELDPSPCDIHPLGF